MNDNGCQRTSTDRRLNGYTISSPCEPNGSGELKIVHHFVHNLVIFVSCFFLLFAVGFSKCILEEIHTAKTYKNGMQVLVPYQIKRT